MNLLDIIKERQMIHSSWLPVIFWDTLDDEEYWEHPQGDFAQLSRDILLFYFGLMQGYCFAKAQALNCTIAELPLNKGFVQYIKDIWDVAIPDRLSETEQLFSFMTDTSKIEGAEPKAGMDIFGQDAFRFIVAIKDEYLKLARNARSFLNGISEELFLNFLDSLKLLKTTSFDSKEMKICFEFPEGTVKIKCSPFMSFLSIENGSDGDPVDRLTNHCYILTSVAKTDQNNNLYFDTVGINALYYSTGSKYGKKRICREVTDNENLKLLCRTAGIETTWYSADVCWCDLKFLNRIVEASERVILRCCGVLNPKKETGREIQEELKLILDDSRTFSEKYKGEVLAGQLNGMLFELFLEDGLFKTMRTVMLNSPLLEKASSRLFFEQYLEEFVKAGVITREKHHRIAERCQEKIAISLNKLEHIVPRNSEAYITREREIRAEWKSFYVLKAAGIKSNRLFPDVETILSIDDYYDMLFTNAEAPDKNMMQLLRMLCVFYEALLMNKVPFDEAKYFKDAHSIASKYSLSKHTMESLFNSFVEIAEKSMDSEDMSTLLGRKGIVEDIENLKNQYQHIVNAKLSPRGAVARATKVGGHKMFISYAHEDIDKVKPIVEQWKKEGYDFFFDENEIREGDDWLNKAYEAIHDDACTMFVIFVSKNSVRKNSVLKEFVHAKMNEKSKCVNDCSFIVPINLENPDEGIDGTTTDKTVKLTYIKEIAHSVAMESDSVKRSIADEFWNMLVGDHPNADYVVLSPHEKSFDARFRDAYRDRTSYDGAVVSLNNLDEEKLQVANFYAYLKYGKSSYRTQQRVNDYINDETENLARCIFPILASIKDAQFKRDNIAIVGYEMIRGKGRHRVYGKKILTSKRLDVDDYYCIPKYRSDGETGNWMVDPLLIRCDKLLEILTKAR